MVFIGTLFCGVMLASSVAWIRYGEPSHNVIDVDHDYVDAIMADSIITMNGGTYDMNTDYFYRDKVQITTRRGIFPFIVRDYTILTVDFLGKSR